MSDYCQILGVRVPRPRAGAHEPWCAAHEDGMCRSRVDQLPGEFGAWLESDGLTVSLVVDGARGHVHVSLDEIR